MGRKREFTRTEIKGNVYGKLQATGTIDEIRKKFNLTIK